MEYKQKKNAYIQYIRNKTPENWKITGKKFTKGMKEDIYERQRIIWGLLRRNKLEVKYANY